MAGEEHRRGDLQHRVGRSTGHQVEQLVPSLLIKNTTDTIGSTRKPRMMPTTRATGMFLIKIPRPMPIKLHSAIEHAPRMIERQVPGSSSRKVPPLPSTKGTDTSMPAATLAIP